MSKTEALKHRVKCQKRWHNFDKLSELRCFLSGKFDNFHFENIIHLMSKEIFRLPGLVDAHVHLREPGSEQKEDFETGTRAAIAGGFTTVIDMPNNPEGFSTTSPEAMNNKITLSKNRIYSDLGFYFGGTLVSGRYFEKVKDEVFGLKVYMNDTTGPLLVEKTKDRVVIFKKWPRNKNLLVHAENETVEEAIVLARRFGNRLHICHVSQKAEIEAIREAKEEGLKITCEVTPHHLFLTENDVSTLGVFGLMRPQLRTKEDQEALWKNIDIIDIIASDHAPHTIEEKKSYSFFGVPGLETTLPLMLTAVASGRISLKKLINLISTKPMEIFKVRDDKNTYTEVDLKESYLIDSHNLQTKCGWTPFEGRKVTGKITKVVLRGEVVFDGEKIIGIPKGKIISPIC